MIPHSVLVGSVKYVARIVAIKAMLRYLDDRAEYQASSRCLTDQLVRIEQSIDALRTKELMASLEHFKIAIALIRGKNTLCEHASRDLVKSRDLAIIAYDAVQSIDKKLTATKICIATSILLFGNDRVACYVGIGSAIERLAVNPMIQKTVANECRGGFTLWKAYRREFVEELRDLVRITHQYLAHVDAMHDQMDEMDRPNELDKPDGRVMIGAMIGAMIGSVNRLVPVTLSRFSTNFLFWETLNIPSDPISLCVINGRDLLVGGANNKIMRLDGDSWHYMDMPYVRSIDQLADQSLFLVSGNVARVILLGEPPIGQGAFPVNTEYVSAYAFNILRVGKAYLLADTPETRRFINTHPVETTIVHVNKIDPSIVRVEKVGHIGYHDYVTCGCELLDGTMVVSTRNEYRRGRGTRYLSGSLLVLRDYIDPPSQWDAWKEWRGKQVKKISFDDPAFYARVLDNGHLLVVTRNGVYVVYPSDSPRECLVGADEQKWTCDKITAIQNTCDDLRLTRVRIHKDIILIGDHDHYKVIQRSCVDPIKYLVREIYGTVNPIIDIDMFDDARICTLDNKGVVMMWSMW